MRRMKCGARVFFSLLTFFLVVWVSGGYAAPAEQGLRAEDGAPFGLQDVPPEYDPRLNDLGAQWVRLSGAAGAVWDADEPRRGTYDWRRLDRIIGGYSRHGVNLLVTILSFNSWDRGVPGGSGQTGPLPVDLPHDRGAFKNYLRALVQRHPSVLYWQIENEPDGNGWKDTPENFALLVKESSETIREANPNARIVLGGMAVPEGFYRFYLPMLSALSAMQGSSDARFFDVVDVHWSAQFGGNYRQHGPTGGNLADFLPDLSVKLGGVGYRGVSIWITEMSNYDGQPRPEPQGDGRYHVFTPHSEADHAAELIKSHVFSLAHGVEKVFWARLEEWANFCGPGVNCYWDNTGLINNPTNDGQRRKKLAYYAYKLMLDKLANVQWHPSEIVRESDDVYLYKIMKEGKPIWVAWNDSMQDKRVTIFGIPSHHLTITESVPRADSGRDVVNYHAAFSRKTVAVKQGVASFVLGKIPVYIEVKKQ